MATTDRVDIVEEDHRLERGESSAIEAFARHRWHWTLDESNTERMSFREYARMVGRDNMAVLRHAKGYAAWVQTDQSAPLGDFIARAAMGIEREAVTEAVAQARGLTFQTATRTRSSEIGRIREQARDAAERRGTTVEEEAPKIATMAARLDETELRIRDERAARRTLRYIEVEGLLRKALRPLNEAVKIAGLTWDDEERELLIATVAQIRELLLLLDSRITGTARIDWDAELTAIMEKVS
jgi:hypothetical protein